MMIGELADVQSSFNKFYSDFTLMGKHLGNAITKYDKSRKTAEKFNDKIEQITGNKMELIDS